MLTPTAAHQALTEHPMYRYRGCGPDEEDPRMAAGDPDLSIDAWAAPDQDGAEPQADRHARERAAKRVCGYCPVRVVCAAYANTETAEGALAEPEGIWGGELALDRHRALIQRRQNDDTPSSPTAATLPGRDLAACRSVQKQAVLRSLARETDEELVAYRAGMDVRTANWQRAQLCRRLGLDQETASREQLLDAARTHGVMPRGVRVRPDGRWPVAAAPTTDGIRQRRIGPGRPVQLPLPWVPLPPRRSEVASYASKVPASTAYDRRIVLRAVHPHVEHLTLPIPVDRMETAA